MKQRAELKWIIMSVAGFILRKHGFDPTTVHGKLVEKVASGQGVVIGVLPSSLSVAAQQYSIFI